MGDDDTTRRPELTRRGGLHWKIVRITLGVLLGVLGLLGLFLPVLQGILFLVASVFVLSIDVPAFRRLRAWLARTYPGVFQRVEDWFEGRRPAPAPPPTPVELARRRLHILLPLGGLALAVVCLFYMDSWLDECLYLHHGRLLASGQNIYQTVGTYMPLVYLYFGIPQALYGPSFYLARVQSLVTMVAAWGLAWAALLQLGYRWAPALALAFFVTNLGLVAWAITASPYAPVFLLLSVALWFLARDWARLGNTIGFVVCLALLGWVRQNLFITAIVGLGVYALLHPRRRQVLAVLAVLATATILAAFVWIPSVRYLVQSALSMPTVDTSPITEGQTRPEAVLGNLKRYIRSYGALWLPMLAISLYGAWRLGRGGLGGLQKPQARFFSVVWTLAMSLALTHLIGPLRWDPGVITAYFNYAGAMVCLCIGMGLEHLGAAGLGLRPPPALAGTARAPAARVAVAVGGLLALLVLNAASPAPSKWTPDGRPALPRLYAFARELAAHIRPEDRLFWLVWSRPNPLYLAGLETPPALMNDSFCYSIPDQVRAPARSWDRFIGRAWLAEWATVAVISDRARDRYQRLAPAFYAMLQDVLKRDYVRVQTFQTAWPVDYGSYAVYRRRGHTVPGPMTQRSRP